MIYAVEIQKRRFVKVGFTDQRDVARRIAELQTGCPYRIEEVLTTHGTLIQEQQIHKALMTAFGRIRLPMPPNEWYPGRHPVMEKFLDHLKYGPDAGLTYLDSFSPSVRQPGHKGERSSTAPNFRWPENA